MLANVGKLSSAMQKKVNSKASLFINTATQIVVFPRVCMWDKDWIECQGCMFQQTNASSGFLVWLNSHGQTLCASAGAEGPSKAAKHRLV